MHDFGAPHSVKYLDVASPLHPTQMYVKQFAVMRGKPLFCFLYSLYVVLLFILFVHSSNA